MPKPGGNNINECMEICMSDPKLQEEVKDVDKRREMCYATCMAYLDSGLRIADRFEVSAQEGLYIIDGEPNPTLTLGRGLSYAFDLDVPGHPFFIKTERSTGREGEYNKGVVNNGTMETVLSFDVPMDAPDLLYYNCSIHDTMNGEIRIVDSEDLQVFSLVEKYKSKM